jgi:hypothetical protein
MKRPRGRPKGEQPPMTGSERQLAMRKRLRAEGKVMITVFLGPKAYGRLTWLQQQNAVSQSEAIADALRFTFECAADPDGTKPDGL